MGVDYNGVGGIGIVVTSSMKKKLIILNEGECCDGSLEEVLDDLEMSYKEGGDGNYSGEENTFYLTVEGETLNEINENVEGFLETLNDAGIKVSQNDLKVIEDLHVW